MLEIWKAAVEQFQQGKDFVIATILSVAGSSPRHVGTRFLVKIDGSIVGTIGGGLFEVNVQKFAAQALLNRTSHRALFSFQGRDAQSSDMICGGQAEVLVEFVDAGDPNARNVFHELLAITGTRAKGYFFTDVGMAVGGQKSGPIGHCLLAENGLRIGGFPGDDKAVNAMPERRLLKPAQFLGVPGNECPVFLEWIQPRGTVYVFGGGHVGACVAHLAAYVDFKVVVIDDRIEFANREKIPDAHEIRAVDSFDTFFDGVTLDDDSYVVIVTRGHAHDRAVLSHTLKTGAGYVGMIGSRRKTNLIYQALMMDGFTREDLERVHSPIGLLIGGETPQEIGVSIVAEMIEIRSRKDRIQRWGE